jgi:hypothetical protein
MGRIEYDFDWLQSEADKIGTWKAVCTKYHLHASQISRFKKRGLLRDPAKTAIDKYKAQELYDSGLSLRDVAKKMNVAVSALTPFMKTRTVAEANKIVVKQYTEAGRKKLSDSAKARNLGGYRPHPNRGQWYRDTWFDSKWEVRVAESLDENSIQWQRPKIGFVWTDLGNKYYPDFYLPDFDVYLDPKNSYLQTKDANKISQAQQRNAIRVIVLGEQQLEWSQIKTLL